MLQKLPLQADVEVSFDLPMLDKAEKFDPSWTSPVDLCSQKVASVQGGVGPFGLKVLASKGLEEYTAVFFRIFKGQNNKYIVLMCSDQSRYLFSLKLPSYCSMDTFILKEQLGFHKNDLFPSLCSSSLNDSNDKVNYGAFLNVDLMHEKLSLRTLVGLSGSFQ